MPTGARVGPYRVFFYAGDHDEPPHVHIEHAGKVAKFWLDPIRLERSDGFARRDIARIQKLLRAHHTRLLEAWNDYFCG